MDIDLAGRTNNQFDHTKELFETVCEIDVDPDGIQFNRDAIEVSRVKEDADYEGMRVQFHPTLARARIPMQLDNGFGDVITPGPTEIEYPTLLNFPYRGSNPCRGANSVGSFIQPVIHCRLSGQGIAPTQPGEPCKVAIGRAELCTVLNCQSSQVSVRRQITAGPEG